MQIYLVLEEIINKYPQGLKNYMEKKIQNDDEDYFLKPNNLRELLLSEHLMPFLMQYLKDMKNEAIEILIHPEADKFLAQLECPKEDLSGLEDGDLIKFKEIFNANRISEFHKNAQKTMDTLYDCLIDILAKRVPVENVNVKVEQIMSKIKLISIPEGVVLEDRTEKQKVTKEDGTEVEEEVTLKKNTEEHGLILITVPQTEEEQEIVIEVSGSVDESKQTSEAVPENKEEKEEETTEKKQETKIIKVMVDVDQQDKVLSVVARNVADLEEKSFLLINMYAMKSYREEFMDYIARIHPAFFEDNEDFDQINKTVGQQAQQLVNDYIKKNCGEYEKPCLSFQVNAVDLG